CVELEHDIARPRFSFKRLTAAAAREGPPAVSGDRPIRGGGVAGVGVRIDDVDARYDVAFGHGVGSLDRERSRIAPFGAGSRSGGGELGYDRLRRRARLG